MASDVSSTEVNDVLDDEKEEGEISLDDVSSSEEGQPYKYPHRAFGQCPKCRSTKRCHPWCKTLIINKPLSKRGEDLHDEYLNPPSITYCRSYLQPIQLNNPYIAVSMANQAEARHYVAKDAGLQGKENRKKQRHPKDLSELSQHVGSSSSSTLQEKNDDELALTLSLTPISSDSDMELVGLQKARRRKKAAKKKRRKKSPVVFAGLTVEDLALTINRSLHKLNASEALDIPKKESNRSGSGHSKHHHHHSKKLATNKSSPPPRRHRSPFVMSPSPTPIRKRPRSPVPIKSSSSTHQRLKTFVKKSSPKAQLNSSKESPETPSRGSVTKLLKKVKRLDPYPNKEKERVSLKDKLSNFIKKNENKEEKNENTENCKKLEMENKKEREEIKNKKIENIQIENNETMMNEGTKHIGNCGSIEVIIKKEIEIEEKKDVELDKKVSKDLDKQMNCPEASPKVKEEAITRKSIERIETPHHHHSTEKTEILTREKNKSIEEELVVLPEIASEVEQENCGTLNVEDVKVEPIESIEPIDEIDEPPESQKLPNFCLDDNDEDMELRITALRSAMLKKHLTRVQSGKVLKKKPQQQEKNVPVPRMESPFPSNFEDQFPLLAEVCRPSSTDPNQDIYCPEDMELDSDMENDAISEMCSPYSLADNDASVVDSEINMNRSLYSPSHPTGTPVSKPLAKRQQQQGMDVSFLDTVNQESSRPYSPSDATIYDPELPGVLSAEAAAASTVAPLHPPPMPPLSMFDPSQQMLLGCSQRLLVPFVKPVPMVPPPMVPPSINSFTAIHQSVNPMLMPAPAAPMFAYPPQPVPEAPSAPPKPPMNSSIDLETDIDGSPLVSIEKDTSSTWPLLNEPLYLQGVPNVAQGTVPTIVERSLVPAAVLKSNKHLQKQLVQKKVVQRENLFRHAEMRPVNSQLTSCSSAHFKPIKLSPIIKNSVIANPAPAFNVFSEDAEVNNVINTSAETSTDTLTKVSTETLIEESPKKDSCVVPLAKIGRKRRMRPRNRRTRERKRASEKSSTLEKAEEDVNKEKQPINEIERRESLDEDEETLRQHLLASLSKRNKVAKAEATINEAKNTVASVEAIPNVPKAEEPTTKTCTEQGNVDVDSGEQQSDLEPLSIRTSISKPNIAPNSLKRSSSSASTAGQPLKKISRKSNEIQASKVVNNAKRYQNSKSQQKLTQQKISLLVASKARSKVDSDTPRSTSPQLTEPVSDSEKFIISVNRDSESDSETEGITVSPTKNRPTLAIPWSDFEKTLDRFLKSARQQHETAASTVEDPQDTSAVPREESEQKTLTPTTSTEEPDTECLATESDVKDAEIENSDATVVKTTNVETGTTVTAVKTTPVTTLSPLAKEFIPSSIVKATKTVSVIEAKNSVSVTTKTPPESVNTPKSVVETVTTGSISTSVDVKTVNTVSPVKTRSTTPATIIETAIKTIATPGTSTGTIMRTIKNINTPAEIVKTVTIPSTCTTTIVRTIKNIGTAGTTVTTKVASSTAVATSLKEKITASTPKPVMIQREMISMSATPQAVKHLPASQQEEYRRLKQQIYEREQRILKAKEARLAATSVPAPTKPISDNIRIPTSSAPALATSIPMKKNVESAVITATPTPKTLNFSKSPVSKTQLVATISPMSKQSQIKKITIGQSNKVKHSSSIAAQGANKTAQSNPISIQNVSHQKPPVKINSSTQLQTAPTLDKQVKLLDKMTAALNDQQKQISAVTQKMQSSLRILTKDQINLKTSQIQNSMMSDGKKVVMDDLNISAIHRKAQAAESARLRTPSVIEKSVNSDAHVTWNSMEGSKKKTNNSEISGSQTWAEFKQMVEIEVQTLLNLPPEEQTLLLRKTENDLITKRHSVLEDIVAMSGSLSEWETERDTQNALSIEVNRLREELRIAEEKLQQQKDKLNSIQPQVSTYHEKINTGRKECFRFSKICGGLGKEVIGSDYKIPNESAELFNRKIKEIATHTLRLKSKNSVSKKSTTSSSLARTDKTNNNPKLMKNSNYQCKESKNENSSLNNEISLSSNVNIKSVGASSNKPTVNNGNLDNSETREESGRFNDEMIRNNVNVIVKREPSFDVHEQNFDEVTVKIEREEIADRNSIKEIDERVQLDGSYVIPKKEKVLPEVIEESRIIDICTLLQNIETDIKRQFTSHSEMSSISHNDCERENEIVSSFNPEQTTEMKMDMSSNNEDLSTEVYDKKPITNVIQSYNVGDLPMNNRVEYPNLNIKNVDKSMLKNIKIEDSSSHQDKTLQTSTDDIINDSPCTDKNVHLEDGKRLTGTDFNNLIPNRLNYPNSENKIMKPKFGVQNSDPIKTDNAGMERRINKSNLDNSIVTRDSELSNDSILESSNRIENNSVGYQSAMEVDVENVTERNSIGFENQFSIGADIKKSFENTNSASPPNTESIDVGVEFKSSLPTIVTCLNQETQFTDSVAMTSKLSNKHIDPLTDTAYNSATENLLTNPESTSTKLSSTKINQNNTLFKVEKFDIDDLNDSDIEDYLFDSNFCNISEISNTEHSTLLDEIELLELASQVDVPGIISQYSEKSENEELLKQPQIQVKQTLEPSQKHIKQEIESMQQLPQHNKNTKLIQHNFNTKIGSAQHNLEQIKYLKSSQQNLNLKNVQRFSKHNKIVESLCQNSKSVIEKVKQSKLEMRSAKQLLQQTEKKELPLGNFNRAKRKAVKPYESVLKHLYALRYVKKFIEKVKHRRASSASFFPTLKIGK